MPSDGQKRRRAAKQANARQQQSSEHDVTFTDEPEESASAAACSIPTVTMPPQRINPMPFSGLRKGFLIQERKMTWASGYKQGSGSSFAEQGQSVRRIPTEQDLYATQAFSSAAQSHPVEQGIPRAGLEPESSGPVTLIKEAGEDTAGDIPSRQAPASARARPLSCPPALCRQHMSEQELAPPVFWRNGLVPSFHGRARADVGFLRPGEEVGTAPRLRLRGRERCSFPEDVGLPAGMSVAYSNTFLDVNTHMSSIDCVEPQASIGSLQAAMGGDAPRVCRYYHQNPSRDTCKSGYLCTFRHENHFARPGAGERERRRRQVSNASLAYNRSGFGVSEASAWPTSRSFCGSWSGFIESAGLVMLAASATYVSSCILKKVLDSPIAALGGSYHASQASFPIGHPARSRIQAFEECAVSGVLPKGCVWCPMHHELVLSRRPHFMCDRCECRNEGMAYTCRRCDFDLCEACYSIAEDCARPIDLESWLPPKPAFQDPDAQALSQAGALPPEPVWMPPPRPTLGPFKLPHQPRAPMLPPPPMACGLPDGPPHKSCIVGSQIRAMVWVSISARVPLALAAFAVLLLMLLSWCGLHADLVACGLYFIIAFGQWCCDGVVQHENKDLLQRRVEEAKSLSFEQQSRLRDWSSSLREHYLLQGQRIADWHQRALQWHVERKSALQHWYKEVEQAAPRPFQLPPQPRAPMLPPLPQLAVLPEGWPCQPHGVGVQLRVVVQDMQMVPASVPSKVALFAILLSSLLTCCGIHIGLLTYGLFFLVALAQWCYDVVVQHQNQEDVQQGVDRARRLNDEWQTKLQMWASEVRKLSLLQEEQKMRWQRQALHQHEEHTRALQQWHEEVEQAPERRDSLLQKYRRASKQWYLDVEHVRQIFQEQWCEYIHAVADYNQRFKRFRLQAWARELRSWQQACRQRGDARRVFLNRTFGNTLGSIIAFRRRGYMHYGIGDGRGSVVHFTSDGVIQLECMAAVADNSQRWNVVEDAAYGSYLPHWGRHAFPGQEVLSRALRCLQDHPRREYSITRYNCEHFATEMRFGHAVCAQKHHIVRGVEELERTFFGTDVARYLGNTDIGQRIVDGFAGFVGRITDGESTLDGTIDLAVGLSAPTATFSQMPSRQRER